jgi:hypothetical protein
LKVSGKPRCCSSVFSCYWPRRLEETFHGLVQTFRDLTHAGLIKEHS